MPDFVIDVMRRQDWDDVRAIYLQGIETGDATFEDEVPTWEEWDSSHLGSCRLVARGHDKVIAWTALSPVSNRECYRGVAEITLYVAADQRGRGVGLALGQAVVQASEAEGIWTLQAMVFPTNRASLALFEHGGFRRVGVRKRIGRDSTGWRDVVLLERRSEVVGIQ